MICQLIKLPFRLAEEAIWLARAAAEVYGYGVRVGAKDREDSQTWALSNDEIDRLLK